MWDVLAVTFPFFALVLAGYAAAMRRMLPIEAIPGLNTFVLYFALPCMLFRFGASTPLAKLLVGDVSPVLLSGLLYLGSGVGLGLFSAATRFDETRVGRVHGSAHLGLGRGRC